MYNTYSMNDYIVYKKYIRVLNHHIKKEGEFYIRKLLYKRGCESIIKKKKPSFILYYIIRY